MLVGHLIALLGALTTSCNASANSIGTAAATPTVNREAARVRAPLRVIADIPLPGAARRFDYQSFDPKTGRLYISHMYGNRLDVFDTRAQKLIASNEGFPGATGVLSVPELHKVYVSVTGRHEVVVVDDRTLAVVARVTGVKFPDGIAYAPAEQKVFVSDESGAADLVIDARTNARIGVIPLGGEAGNTHYDAPSNCIVVAVQTKNEIVAIDPTTDRVVQRYGVPCNHPHGFLIDEAQRLAFVTCEGDSQLLIVNLRTMKTITSLKIPNEPDVLAFDDGLQRLYIGCESGAVAVFEEREGSLVSLGEYRAPHAHTVAVDPGTHMVYLPLQDVGGKPVLRILSPYAP